MSKQAVVVALDGSELSERALPYAVALARASEAPVHLVTVWEEGERALIEQIPDVKESVFKKGEEHWERYLVSQATAIQSEGVDVETEVLLGDPANEILELIDRIEAKHLAIATHGRSGLSRWRYGSVASRLLREAPLPTLVVGPAVLEGEPKDATLSRILVPLDGSPLSETALRPAAELARKVGAELVLSRVLQWSTQAAIYGVPDVDVAKIDEELSEGAEAYLEKVCEWLKPPGEPETVVMHGPPADALITLVSEHNIDLVVMSSHTRGGIARAVLGSVADRLIHGEAPVYLIRPESPVPFEQPGRGRYCHSCGRASPYVELLPDDKCIRCGQHLRACGNCVYFDGIACIAGRPEQHDTYPGRNCPYFHFRETPSPLEAMIDGHEEARKK